MNKETLASDVIGRVKKERDYYKKILFISICTNFVMAAVLFFNLFAK